MFFFLFYKVINIIFSGVFIPAIIILSVVVSISISNIYARSLSSYWDISLSLTSLSTFLIKCITGSGLMELPYISIL